MDKYPEEIDILFMSYAHIPFRMEIEAKAFRICWGDSHISIYQNNSFYRITHTFIYEGLYHIQISGIDIRSINVSHLSLNALNLVHCPSLEYLDCSVNELNTLDLSYCPLLEELYCNSNNLTQLDLSFLPYLQQANIAYNILEKLNVTTCRSLQSLQCSCNHLKIIELSEMLPLYFLDISHNLLDSEQLNQIFSHLPITNRGTILYYSHNPGSAFCDAKILKTRNWQ